MTKKVMEQLNLRISRPYHNICAMDNRTIEVHGLIKGLQVHLTAFPDIMNEMEIVVVDVLDTWGMLLSRNIAVDLGGSLQMDLTYATIPTPNGLEFKLNRELERKYHVEDPKKKKNEIVFWEVEMGCYEIEHTLTSSNMELDRKPPSTCNVWDPMDSFDGFFLEENSEKTDNNVPPSDSKSKLDLSVENVSSTQPTSIESVICQKQSDGILGPHPPSFSKIGKVKDKISNDNLIGITKDDKINVDKVKYTIPSKRYARHFKEKISSQILHFAPMENHQKFFKGNHPKWPKDRN
jgi:hypothetical protein